MPFLLLLVALFIFAQLHGEHEVSFITLIMIIVALLVKYYKPVRDSLREFF